MAKLELHVCVLGKRRQKPRSVALPLPQTAHGGAEIVPHNEIRELLGRGNRREKARKTARVHYVPLDQETHTIALESVRTCQNIRTFVNSLFCCVCDR